MSDPAGPIPRTLTNRMPAPGAPTRPTEGRLPAPAAARLRRPSWRDPRLAVGVLLVAVAVVVGVVAVSAADDSEPFYVAASTLTPGEAVGPDDVRVVQARLPEAGQSYLSAERELPVGVVALRTVPAGELLARSAVGPARDVTTQPVGIPLRGALPGGLVEGARVDVWIADPDPERAGGFVEPRRVVDAAVVAEVTQDTGALGTGGGTTVQVLLGQESLGQVLGALANRADVALVLMPGGGD